MLRFHTYDTETARRRRKRLGQWNADFAKAVWTTKEDKEIMVRDMGDGHLLNTIKLLYRAAAGQKNKDDLVFLMPPFPQGDMAQMAFDEAGDQQFDRQTEEYVQDVYWDMMAEARLRGFDMEELAREFNKIEMSYFAKTIGVIQRVSDLG